MSFDPVFRAHWERSYQPYTCDLGAGTVDGRKPETAPPFASAHGTRPAGESTFGAPLGNHLLVGPREAEILFSGLL